jgi:hypothetical protein
VSALPAERGGAIDLDRMIVAQLDPSVPGTIHRMSHDPAASERIERIRKLE